MLASNRRNGDAQPGHAGVRVCGAGGELPRPRPQVGRVQRDPALRHGRDTRLDPRAEAEVQLDIR